MRYAGAAFLLLLSTTVHAQLSFGGQPLGAQASGLGWPDPPEVALPAIDEATLRAEDDRRMAAGPAPFRFGAIRPVDLSTTNSGDWHTLLNGDRIWRLGIRCTGARSINFTFDTFVVPEGGQVFVYTPAGDRLGAFTAASSAGRTRLGVGVLPGDRITIEYHEPAAVAGQGRLHISEVTHGYRSSFGTDRGFGNSAPCMRNVICPEGDPWRDQIRSAGMVLVNGNAWCSGTLLNSCGQDGAPYFLTADHCLQGNEGDWVFAFNWSSPTCTPSTDIPIDRTVSGSEVLASDFIGDYALLRLNTAPPASYNVFYSGWDHSGAPFANGVAIHHPFGDQTKISTSSTMGTSNWNGAMAWQVQLWDLGAVEGGSSGSGLWDPNGRVVGQLYGGAGSCDNPAGYDYYGALHATFPAMSPWLGGCATAIDGYDPVNAPTGLDVGAVHLSVVPDVICDGSDIAPQLEIWNAGDEYLNFLDVAVAIDGVAQGSFPVGAPLFPGEHMPLLLPSFTVGPGTHTVTAVAVAPNGQVDIRASNDTASCTVTVDPSLAVADVAITTDAFSNETTWGLYDQTAGGQLLGGGPYTDPNSTIHATACLPSGHCYYFEIDDAHGDGICCAYGNGHYGVTVNGEAVVTGDGQFGSTMSHTFCLGATGVEEAEQRTPMTVFPNPGKGPFTFSLPWNSASRLTIDVLDAAGRFVLQRTVASPGRTFMFDADLPAGSYVVQLRGGAEHAVTRLAITP